MDPKVKVEGAKNIFNFIAIFTNQPSQLKGILYEQLNTYMNIMKLNIVILFFYFMKGDYEVEYIQIQLKDKS